MDCLTWVTLELGEGLVVEALELVPRLEGEWVGREQWADPVEKERQVSPQARD